MTSTTTRGLLYSSLHRFNNALENLESFQKEKEGIAPNKLEQFRRVRDTYTHLAIWTNTPWIATRLCDTIF